MLLKSNIFTDYSVTCVDNCVATWKKELGYSLHQKLVILLASGKGTGGGQW